MRRERSSREQYLGADPVKSEQWPRGAHQRVSGDCLPSSRLHRDGRLGSFKPDGQPKRRLNVIRTSTEFGFDASNELADGIENCDRTP